VAWHPLGGVSGGMEARGLHGSSEEVGRCRHAGEATHGVMEAGGGASAESWRLIGALVGGSAANARRRKSARGEGQRSGDRDSRCTAKRRRRRPSRVR